MLRRVEQRSVPLSFLQIISRIVRLKRKELLKLEEESSVTKNLRDLGVSGQTRTAQVLPLPVLWVIYMVTKLALPVSPRPKSGKSNLMTSLWSSVLMVFGMLSAVPRPSGSSPSIISLPLPLFRNPEDPSQMARALANEARERWDLFNEINRTKKKLSLEGMDEVRKKSSLANFEQNIMRDDITVVIGYLQNIA